jgi:ribosomal protein L3
MKAILGIKKGMTRVIRDGKQIPVTVVDVANCKLAKIDGEYSVLGLGQKKKSNKAMEGQYKELGFVPKYTKTFKGIIEGMEAGSDILPTYFLKAK